MQSTTLALTTTTDGEFHMVSIRELPQGESASKLERERRTFRMIVMLNVTLRRVAAARVWNALRACMQAMTISESSEPKILDDFNESTSENPFTVCHRVITLYASETAEESVSATSSEEEFDEYKRLRYASDGVEIGSAPAELSARRAARIREEMLRLIASDSELRDAEGSLAATLRRRCGVSISEGSNWLYPSSCEIETPRCEPSCEFCGAGSSADALENDECIVHE